MKKKAWWCPTCKKFVSGHGTFIHTAQKTCKKCGSFLILEMEKDRTESKKED